MFFKAKKSPKNGIQESKKKTLKIPTKWDPRNQTNKKQHIKTSPQHFLLGFFLDDFLGAWHRFFGAKRSCWRRCASACATMDSSWRWILGEIWSILHLKKTHLIDTFVASFLEKMGWNSLTWNICYYWCVYLYIYIYIYIGMRVPLRRRLALNSIPSKLASWLLLFGRMFQYKLELPPTSNSHRQDYSVFSRESHPKPSFVTVTGRGVDRKDQLFFWLFGEVNSVSPPRIAGWHLTGFPVQTTQIWHEMWSWRKFQRFSSSIIFLKRVFPNPWCQCFILLNLTFEIVEYSIVSPSVLCCKFMCSNDVSTRKSCSLSVARLLDFALPSSCSRYCQSEVCQEFLCQRVFPCSAHHSYSPIIFLAEINVFLAWKFNKIHIATEIWCFRRHSVYPFRIRQFLRVKQFSPARVVGLLSRGSRHWTQGIVFLFTNTFTKYISRYPHIS